MDLRRKTRMLSTVGTIPSRSGLAPQRRPKCQFRCTTVVAVVIREDNS